MKVTSENVWPPGFRFHPTDEELVLYYLKRKICNRRIKMNIIAETDVYKWDPEELPGQSLLKTGDRQWFFFSPRDRKYPNGARSNRATRQGYWKTTGKDRNITCNSRNVGVKKTLVFYKGRAPNGERTDWVMHEYTLDEEELKRCQNMQDYYALYKVFKKSGPGPKNGEQYGAPFKEEEWEDDKDLDVKKTIEQEIPAKQRNEVAAIDNVRPVNQVPSALDDIEEFIKELANELLPLEPQISCSYEAPQVVGEEEAQSTLVNPSSKEVMVSEPVGVCNEQAGFDFTLSASTNMQLYDASEVTSAPKNCEPALQFCEEDFLEMDDLIGPESTISAAEKPAERLQFDVFDELSDLMFHDAAMFLHDLGPVNEELIANVPGNNMLNHEDHQFQLPSGVNLAVRQVQASLVVNQMDHELQPNLMVNQADYQLQTQSFDAEQVVSQPWMQDLDAEHINNQPWIQDFGAEHINNQPWMQGPGPEHINSQPWMHDQLTNVHTPAVSNQGISYRPSSGLVHQPTNRPTEAKQNQSGQEEGGTRSWISSSLWSFVESIPTTPASASESPLVYRALEQMSSFSRLRINAENTNVAAVSDGTITRRQASSTRGFLLFSLFGALCALLWMFMGTIRVVGRSISS